VTAEECWIIEGILHPKRALRVRRAKEGYGRSERNQWEEMLKDAGTRLIGGKARQSLLRVPPGNRQQESELLMRGVT